MKRRKGIVLSNERGEFGIKQIAITVGVIVVIGFIVNIITNSFLSDWIEQVWEMFIDQIEGIMS